MKNLKLGVLTLLTVLMFACNNTTHAQIQMTSDSYGFKTDTLKTGETIKFTTPSSSLIAGVEGKYRLHMDFLNISGTSTFKVIVKSRSNSCTTCGYSNHFGVAGTTGYHTDTLQVTAGSPSTFEWDLTPGSSTNAGRSSDIQVECIAGATQATLLRNFYIMIQKN